MGQRYKWVKLFPSAEAEKVDMRCQRIGSSELRRKLHRVKDGSEEEQG
jgi:hypothetical protein